MWRKLGFSTALEYLEDVFGYSPRTATERLRVAKALGEMPELDEELRNGTLPFSAVRELSRVATRTTIASWLERARGRNLREIESMVSGHARGDWPDDPKDPKLAKRPMTLELDGEARAAWRAMRSRLEGVCGESLDDSQLVVMLYRRELERSASGASSHEPLEVESLEAPAAEQLDDKTTERRAPAPKPAYAIHITTCRDCGRGWQNGSGVPFEVAAATLERMRCDATLLDDDRGNRPTQTIPAATRRRVLVRDEWRCRVPGCRAARGLDVHHIKYQVHGGDHDLENLVVLCSGHHTLLHDGLLRIEGTAPNALRFERNGQVLRDDDRGYERGHDECESRTAPDVRIPTRLPKSNDRLLADTSRASATDPRVVAHHRPCWENVEFARQALQRSGYKAVIAERAVREACAHVGADADLVALIKEAFRRCR